MTTLGAGCESNAGAKSLLTATLGAGCILGVIGVTTCKGSCCGADGPMLDCNRGERRKGVLMGKVFTSLLTCEVGTFCSMEFPL